MPTPTIDALIEKTDVFEQVRDQLGAILLAEVASQRALALAATPPRDPNDYTLRVFLERSNPFGEFLDLPSGGPDPLPLVNIWYNGTTYDKSTSNVVERQKGTSTFYIDCYAYGTSENVGSGGHRPGDLVASLAVHRVARLVRNILMAGTYTYLGMRGVVWGRWIAGLDMMEPAQDSHAAQRVAALRITLQVDHNEFSPQVHGEPFEGLSVFVKRAETGQLFFTASFP